MYAGSLYPGTPTITYQNKLKSPTIKIEFNPEPNSGKQSKDVNQATNTPYRIKLRLKYLFMNSLVRLEDADIVSKGTRDCCCVIRKIICVAIDPMRTEWCQNKCIAEE